MDFYFDLEGFKSLVWVYSSREGVINPETWERIFCKSVYGDWISGDKYMADGKKSTNGFNIKSILVKFTKGNTQTLSVVQCRCPLDEETDIGQKVIETLVNKREESFRDHSLKKMFDVDIIHNRSGNEYNVRIFITEQPKYENENFYWDNNIGYLNPNQSNKRWKSFWNIKRIFSNSSYYQNCIQIKKKFIKQTCIADFTVNCENNYDISIEESKELYSQFLNNGKLE